MFTYKQRYKPRATREYTKNDLTVYDSAGNTALNALTVYGKSEVVDGAIKSAGEGWSTVDLGTLAWAQITDNEPYFYSITISNQIKRVSNDQIANILMTKYTTITRDALVNETANNVIAINNNGTIQIRDTTYTDVTAFKAAMSGVLLCYELADPSQGNTIAIKADNGSGINGTMATFTTGTPLYGISDTVRDVMVWDGSAGEVTKKCAKVRLADLTWEYRGNGVFSTPDITDYKYIENVKAICTKYNYIGTVNSVSVMSTNPDKSIALYHQAGISSRSFYIKNTDYTTVSDFVASLGDAELVYELATPTTEPLTQAENESLAGLRTFDGTTHFTNNATTDMTVNYTIKVPTIS